MSTAVAANPGLFAIAGRGDQLVRLRGIDWAGFLAFEAIRGESSRPRVTYLDGSIYLMSPAHPHERLEQRFGLFVMIVALELRIPIKTAGSTGLPKAAIRGSVEPDQSYYVANEPRVRDNETIDLDVDPPPDLVIEAASTRPAAASLEVYRRLGVPEAWIGTRKRLRIHIRQADGSYARSDRSRAFPFLSADEIYSWVGNSASVNDTLWMVRLQAWVREVLATRLGAGPGEAAAPLGGEP